MTKRERQRALQSIYDKVPKIDCKGWCGDACGPIAVRGIERERMMKRDARTKQLPTEGAESNRMAVMEGRMCPHLTANGRCRIYGDRPMICRLWGVIESLPCHHGCRPERMLTDEEAYRLLFEIVALDDGYVPTEEALDQTILLMRQSGYFAALRPTHPLERDADYGKVVTLAVAKMFGPALKP